MDLNLMQVNKDNLQRLLKVMDSRKGRKHKFDMYKYSSKGNRRSRNRYEIVPKDSAVDPIGLSVLYVEPPIERDRFKRVIVWEEEKNRNRVVVVKSTRFEFDAYCLRVFGCGPGIYNLRPFEDDHKVFDFLFTKKMSESDTRDKVAERIEHFLRTGSIY